MVLHGGRAVVVGRRSDSSLYDYNLATYDSGDTFDQAVKSLNAFIDDTQQYVNGEIRMVLHGGRAVVVGRRSDSSLYDYNLATYDTGDTFDQNASIGFIEIYGLPT